MTRRAGTGPWRSWAEQPGLRITTNLVNCAPEELRMDLPVKVRFEERDDGIFLPLFEPAR